MNTTQRVGIGLFRIVLWIILIIAFIKVFAISALIMALGVFMFTNSTTLATIVGLVSGVLAVAVVWLIMEGIFGIFGALLTKKNSS